jgi:hypothetical protein
LEGGRRREITGRADKGERTKKKGKEGKGRKKERRKEGRTW